MRLSPAVFALAVAAMLVAASHPVAAGATKQNLVTVRFHPQIEQGGGEFTKPAKLQHSGKPVLMGTMPLINERDIVSAMTFPASDGTAGAYFKLDSHGTNLVMQHTFSRRGTFVFVFFNGRQLGDLLIDRPVSDGIITIPSGLTMNDVELIAQAFPPIGKEGQKPAKKPKPKPTPKATPKPAATKPS
jgi:hypothetical protein